MPTLSNRTTGSSAPDRRLPVFIPADKARSLHASHATQDRCAILGFTAG
jgi:hypothetical protein